ncbi:MAG: CbiQ family ECF transporter T component [Micropruina glycogenica]
MPFPGRQTVVGMGSAGPDHRGLMFAATIGARIVVLVLSSVLLVLTTHPGDLMSALTEAGMSPKFAYIISSTLQLIPSFPGPGRRHSARPAGPRTRGAAQPGASVGGC